MKKTMLLAAALCVAMAFTSCKSNESAYKKFYEKAKAKEKAQVTETPVTETKVVDNSDNVPVRKENLSIVDGAGLKNFSVVVGSFSVRANAEGLVQRLKSAGYPAQLAYNSDRNMYRVVATTFDSKGEAVSSRNQLRGTYADAWLLAN